MTNFLKLESEIISDYDIAGQDPFDRIILSRRIGYEAAHLLCHRLYAAGIKPKDSVQTHISLNGWFDNLVAGSESQFYDFDSFLNGVNEAWGETRDGTKL